MKITSITFDRVPRLPGIRPGDLTTIDLENPPAALDGWRLSLRGQQVFLVSPPGWWTNNATSPHDRDPKGPRVIHEFPRSNVYIHWQASEAELDTVVKGGKYEQLFGKPVEPAPVPVEEGKSILSQITHTS